MSTLEKPGTPSVPSYTFSLIARGHAEIEQSRMHSRLKKKMRMREATRRQFIVHNRPQSADTHENTHHV